MSPALTKEQIAREAALDVPEGSCVNLGIGLPVLVAGRFPPGFEVILHSENGIVGMGPAAREEDVDLNLIDAAKNPVTMRPGGAYVSHADSFAIIRGGHIDVSIMGALQVSAGGDLANWTTGEGVPGVGGAMDLVAGARRVVVMMRHVDAAGRPKLVDRCTFPLTGAGVVQRLYTELGIFEPAGDGFAVVGLAEGLTVADVQAVSGARVFAAAAVAVLPRRGDGPAR